MRKVVTGEQAQLYNGDPFAIPVWRAPVYRTPVALVALVQAARACARLARFALRHRVVALAVGGCVLAWRVIGWACSPVTTLRIRCSPLPAAGENQGRPAGTSSWPPP